MVDKDLLQAKFTSDPLFDKDTPEGFRFRTNIDRTSYGDDPTMEQEVERFRETFGPENVVTTEPAYDINGKPWDGIAVHVRIGAQPKNS